ncbi:MAG: YwmB family TATA-box binding protein [Ectobacillus sp.]
MKKTIQILLVLSLGVIVFLIGYKHTEAKRPQEKLEKMAEVLQANGATIQEWAWTAKGEEDSVHDIHTFEQLLEQIGAKINVVNWNVEQSAEGYKATAEKIFPDYKERLVVTWTNVNTKHKTFIIYEAKGTKWSETIVNKTDKIFSQKPTIYTCVRAVLSDKIEGVLLNKATKILNGFEAKPVEALQERAFVTVSAYTGMWNDALAVNKEKINVQVALRNADNKTTIMVGTPIIMSEY